LFFSASPTFANHAAFAKIGEDAALINSPVVVIVLTGLVSAALAQNEIKNTRHSSGSGINAKCFSTIAP